MTLEEGNALRFPILDRIRLLRAAGGLSLQQVSKNTGNNLSPAYIHQLERGRIKTPSPHKLRQLAPALGTEYMLLMAWAGYIYDPQIKPEDVDPVSIMAKNFGVEGLTLDEAIMLRQLSYEYKKCTEAGMSHDQIQRAVNIGIQAMKGEEIEWGSVGL